MPIIIFFRVESSLNDTNGVVGVTRARTELLVKAWVRGALGRLPGSSDIYL